MCKCSAKHKIIQQMICTATVTTTVVGFADRDEEAGMRAATEQTWVLTVESVSTISTGGTGAPVAVVGGVGV